MERGQEDGLSVSAVDQYVRQVRQIPHLSDDEEAQLLLSFAAGVDRQQAQTRLVEGYQQVVVKLAWRFVRDCCHMELLDFAQEGSLGPRSALCSAVLTSGNVASVWLAHLVCLRT